MVGKSAKRDDSSPKKEKRTFRKSPARSPSRTAVTLSSRPALRKSPSRTTVPKSPSRKSPSRKSPSRREPPVVDRPKRSVRSSKLIVDIESGSEDSDSNFNLRLTPEKPKATVRGRARKLISEATASSSKNLILAAKDIIPVQTITENYVGVTRRSISKLQAQEIDHIDPIKHESLISSIQKLTELSDEDDMKSAVKQKSKSRSLSHFTERKEIVGNSSWLSSILNILFLTTFPVAYFTFCNESQCRLTKLPNFSKFHYLHSYLDLASFAISFGYGLLILLMSAIPFGGFKVSGLPNKQGKLDYRMNGVFVAISAAAAVVILEIYNVPVIDNIVSKQFQLLISSSILGIILSIWLYIRSFYVPLTALKSDVLTNGRVYNFLKGRELNPRLFGTIDVKICLYRFFIIGIIIIDGILLYKDIKIGRDENGVLDLKSTKYNLTLLIATITQLIYVFDFLYFERSFVTTANAQYDAVGYEITLFFTHGSLLVTSGSKYIYDYNVHLPWWHLTIAFLIFCIGYFLYRSSNNQKHKFRQNPYNPSISHMETLATSQGKKLLVSGYWGWVRHPNYLGVVIVHVAFVLFVYNTMPALIMVLTIAMMVQRSHEDGIRCKQRYGSAWTRYCERVKYVLIPKIY